MKCPCCGYEDSPCWHYPVHHGLEMPYARIEEIRIYEPQLAERIEKGHPLRPKVLEYVNDHYAYKYNLQSGFVRRREIALWKIQKWNHIPMEKRKRAVAGVQIELVPRVLLGNKSP